ncbi:MAG: hypothetical protein B7Z66_14480 [Chromatiales bacterium 21-64-14]|nr:MAG: hypothetical protein B7Z66_14480 [Chromatiales bacterium 21-64-14]
MRPQTIMAMRMIVLGLPGLLGYMGAIGGGRVIARQVAGRIWPGQAMVEPIVTLDGEGYIGYELLYRPSWSKSGRFPVFRGQWRAWYERLCVQEAPALLDTIDGWVALNLDDWQVLDPWILGSVAQLRRYGARVVVEWTEHGQEGGAGAVPYYLHRLRNECGFRLSIDDAGTGRDAFDRIVAIEPDIVKIDGGLFRKTRVSGPARHAVQALVGVAGQVGARVVVEHVETAEDLDRARGFGADYGQGWLWPGKIRSDGESKRP